jgi:sec-independent protein translocase protein TatA
MNNLAVFLGVIGPWQIVIIVVLALLLFGGKKIPELMKGLGEGMREFKKARDQMSNDDKTELKKEALE